MIIVGETKLDETFRNGEFHGKSIFTALAVKTVVTFGHQVIL
jgi:hypothetical protein